MLKLRDYQSDVLNLIRTELKNGNKKILISAPTGFGKTILSLQIATNATANNKRVLFTSHRIQLAGQSAKVFSSLNPNYLQGSSDIKTGSNLTICTLQTVINRTIERPDIVIIDEVHYAYESMLVQSLFNRFSNAIFLGLSATPVDNRGYLLDGFDAIIDKYQTGDLINIGALVPFQVYSPVSPNLLRVKVERGDYNTNELGEVMREPYIVDGVIDNYFKLGDKRKFLCFAVNKEHAEILNKAFLKSGIKTAVITADTPTAERNEILNDLKTGSINGVINIEILTAGFDEPSLGCIILACPTKSWKKFIQSCGRGIRTAENKKDCILIDCSRAIEEHGMPDTRRQFIFKEKISRVIDREFSFSEDINSIETIKKTLSEEKQIYLKKIGSLLDLYENKTYSVEAELQEDVNNFISKTDYFAWRQNSGKMFKDGRWIHFASKSGLPDNTVFFRFSSIYFGIELKLKTGRLTPHQKQTLPEMVQKRVLFFICESVFDVFTVFEFVEKHVICSDMGVFISNEIYNLFHREIDLRKRLKIPLYG